MAITTATVKTALRIDYTDDDAEFTRLIAAAVAWVERYTNVGLSSATRTLKLASWSEAVLPVDPFVSLTSVTYYNGSNALTTMPSTDYWVDQTGDLPRIRFLDAPSIYEGTQITVTYVAGHATEPADMVQAVISIVGAWYNNPEATQPVPLSVVPMGAMYLLEHYKVKGPLS
jgi:uncharacterized phiE125 gp8 family phage protein